MPALLRNCTPHGSCLLIVKYFVDDSAAGVQAKLFDLHMVVYFGAGRGRTAGELRVLLEQSGFALQCIVECSAVIAVTEATSV